jgi:hypothetical protein
MEEEKIMELKITGTSDPFEWTICRMEYAANCTSPTFMGWELTEAINPDDHYCYKICLRNISTKYYLNDIYAELKWKIIHHPAVSSSSWTIPKVITLVEPYMHAAMRVHPEHCCLSDCNLILFRDLEPGESTVSAITFQLHGMTEGSKFHVQLERIHYKPAEKKTCYVFLDHKYATILERPIEEYTTD